MYAHRNGKNMNMCELGKLNCIIIINNFRGDSPHQKEEYNSAWDVHNCVVYRAMNDGSLM